MGRRKSQSGYLGRVGRRPREAKSWRKRRFGSRQQCGSAWDRSAAEQVMAEKVRLGLLEVFWRGRDAIFGAGEFFFHALVEPFFEQLLRAFSKAVKTEAGAAFQVGPGHFGFDIDAQVDVGNHKLQARRGSLGHGVAQDRKSTR